MHKIPRPSPALVVASLALAVALSGSAVAAGIVPLAKRALNADNAKHALVADTAKKLGPQSTAAGLVVVKSASGGQLSPNSGQAYSISCDPGQKIMGAGYSSDAGAIINIVQSNPTSDTSWTIGLGNLSDSSAANITIYATCL